MRDREGTQSDRVGQAVGSLMIWIQEQAGRGLLILLSCDLWALECVLEVHVRSYIVIVFVTGNLV